jgi:integrase
VHVVKRINPNGAAAKRGYPAAIVDGVVTGGIVRRVSPAMIDAYHEYLAEDYHRVRAVAQTELVLVQLAGEQTGSGLSTHGARQMIERAGRRAGLGLIKPHAFRHTWATALTEATGGNTKAVADEGGWSSAQTVEQTYAHVAGEAALQAALEQVWGQPS